MSTVTQFIPQLPPVILVHLVAALIALVTGPVALWSRKGTPGHRKLGYVWVLAMVVAAVSAGFIRSTGDLQWHGFSPIHLMVPFALLCLVKGVRHAMAGQIQAHRKTMRNTYLGACLLAGVLAFMPGRTMHTLVVAPLLQAFA